MRSVHVVGAGLAGLAAALSLSAAGRQVTLYEGAPAAGGRCRSYFDRELDARIDNGNHLLLSGNRAAFAYLDEVGARDSLTGPGTPCFPFMDLGTGERWTVRPNAGRLPWWVLMPGRRVPGASLRDFGAILALRHAKPDATVAQMLPRGALTRRLLEPLAIAALNTPPETASACLLSAVMQETLAQGGAACIPAFPRDGLSESFIDPALARLRAQGAVIQMGRRVTALTLRGRTVIGLGTSDGPSDFPAAAGATADVVLAVPPAVAAGLMPGLTVPDAFEAILNLHYRIDAAPGEAGFIGLVGGVAEWVFVKPGVVSVTISAANRLADAAPEALAARVWADVRAALGLPEPLPAWRVLREKRATFAATPAQAGRRPGPRTTLDNLVLAGDWTATGLPATIEGAIRSGRAAADVCLTQIER